MQHMQRAGTQSGGAERRRRGLHHTRVAAAVRCFAQERRALAIAHRYRKNAGSRKEKGPNSLKFVRGETYHILVSEPLTRRASAIAVMPWVVKVPLPKKSRPHSWFLERSRLVSEPLAASAGARAAAPAAPSMLSLRLRNEGEHATGHQQGKRRLRMKFGFWANLLYFRERAVDA